MMPELVKGTEDMGWMYEIITTIYNKRILTFLPLQNIFVFVGIKLSYSMSNWSVIITFLMQFLMTFYFSNDHHFILFFRLPTDIQAEAIPMILGGGDVLMVKSQSLNYYKGYKT